MQKEMERKFVQVTPRGDAQETSRRLVLNEDDYDEKSNAMRSNGVATSSAANYACAYPECIIAQNYELKNVIRIKQRLNRIDERAKAELEQRLKVSYGKKNEKTTARTRARGFKSSAAEKNQKNRRTYDLNADSNFMQELIEPCECGVRYHRVCIRERIVMGNLKKCPECQSGYSVGFTDCYALFNRARPNSLAYMFVQEILLFLSIIAFSEAIRWTAIYTWNVDNPSMLL